METYGRIVRDDRLTRRVHFLLPLLSGTAAGVVPPTSRRM
jgi:hypothetical protein